jgi:hypothetical protein
MEVLAVRDGGMTYVPWPQSCASPGMTECRLSLASQRRRACDRDRVLTHMYYWSVRRPYGVRVPVWGLRLVVRQGILCVVVSSTVVVGLPLCLRGVDHTSLLNLEAGGPGTTLTMALGRLLSHLANL